MLKYYLYIRFYLTSPTQLFKQLIFSQEVKAIVGHNIRYIQIQTSIKVRMFSLTFLNIHYLLVWPGKDKLGEFTPLNLK